MSPSPSSSPLPSEREIAERLFNLPRMTREQRSAAVNEILSALQDAQWATLARSYEATLKALCESDDPAAMLADWCAGAGLPAPKAPALQDARRAALEEAMKALCFCCQAGWPASRYKRPDGPWMHQAPGASVPGHYCDAGRIRSLPSPSPGGKTT
jgi:hypothetical protein